MNNIEHIETGEPLRPHIEVLSPIPDHRSETEKQQQRLYIIAGAMLNATGL